LRHGSEDCLNNPIEIFDDLVIPEADNAIALFGEIRGPSSVATKPKRMTVLLTIKLNDETKGVIREIRDIGADRCLAPEMSVWHFDKTQGAP
jgi:hypothetical protein